MMERLINLIAVISLLVLSLSCAHVDKRIVSLNYRPPKQGTEKIREKKKLTVNDFQDVRENREIVGVDYTTASDIVTSDPLGIAVADVVAQVMKEKGFDLMRVSRKGNPLSYAKEFEQDFHLTGKIEKLSVSVKRGGVLATVSSRGRIYFHLFNSDGELVWKGRLRSESSLTTAYGTNAAIEESLVDCITLMTRGMVEDDKFIDALRKE